MSDFDPEFGKRFLQVFEEATAVQPFPRKFGKLEDFDAAMVGNFEKQWHCRPFVMEMTLSFYRHRLAMAQRQLNDSNVNRQAKEGLTEKVVCLQFASQFGRIANAHERAWCHLQFQRYRIARGDAPFLVWSGTVNFKRRAIVFGHWDWIAGIFMMMPIAFAAMCTVLVALCASPWSLSLGMCIFGFTFATCQVFQFYKAVSFDTFRIGKRYFKPEGWRYVFAA